jgi:hypothetical protein
MTRLVFAPDGRSLAASGERVVWIWNVSKLSDPPIEIELPAVGGQGALSDLALSFSPDGRKLAIGGFGGAHIWDLKQPRTPPIELLRNKDKTLETEWVHALAFSPDGRHLASGSSGFPLGARAVLRLWDLAQLDSLPVGYPSQVDHVEAVSFSPDGRYIAAGGIFRRDPLIFDTLYNVMVWDLERPSDLPLALRPRQGTIRALSYSPDGSSVFVTTGSWGHIYRLRGKDTTGFTSRLLPGWYPRLSEGGFRFLDRSGDQLQIAAMPTGDRAVPATLRFDVVDDPPIPGDPEALLADWQKRLALKIGDYGEIVPANQPGPRERLDGPVGASRSRLIRK